MFFSIGALAQKASLSGKVIDQKDKSELIGVTVTIKGTALGASTDAQGKYQIKNISPGTYTIEVSYIGYAKKIFTNIRFEKDEKKVLDIALSTSVLTFSEEVTVVGEKPLVDIEQSKTERSISMENIEAAPVRQVQGLLNTQAGVVLNPEGISIRGGRTYETAFMIDGVSASDPLAGTGFGIDLGTNSIDNISVTTGGGDVQYGDGTAGIVNTSTRSGGKRFEFGGGVKRDNLGFNSNWASVWNNSTYEFSMGGPLDFISKKLKFFTSLKSIFDDQFYRRPANQVVSSLYPNTSWSPYQDNRWAGMFKLDYEINPKIKLSVTYLKSVTINQDVNMLRVTGNDVPFLPGFQYEFSLQPDRANTYTSDNNMLILNWAHNVNKKFSYKILASRMFVRLRADANGRYWRPGNVDSEFDPDAIITFPSTLFNPADSAVFVNPGPGLFNNGGIGTLWHDHYVEELTTRFNGTYYYSSSGNRILFGAEIKRQDMQWIDIIRPWIGAPIILPNGQTTQSFRLGDYSDVWKVTPTRGAFYASNKLKYKGLNAEFGGRLEYWFPGAFVDQAVADSRSPIRDEIRQDYLSNPSLMGNRFKMRFLPKISASFPIRENQVMFFNYNHSMVLPHPSFIYQGLNPLYQDRSVVSRVGNPNLNPEVDISYELGLKTQITNNDAFTVTTYWKDKYDFITAASIQIKDANGRELTRTIRINSDYARARGIELSYLKRIGKWFNGQAAVSYSTVRGQSSSANEALNQLLNTGNREDTRETPLAWDSPLDLKGVAIFTVANKTGLWGKKWLNNFSFYFEGIYRTGRRYTPFIFRGIEPITNRPIYERDPNPASLWSGLGESNWWVDMNFRKWFSVRKVRFEFSIQITNLFNTLNGIVPNPVTGRAYRYGDPLPSTQRDPLYLDPRDARSYGTPPDDPSRFRAPRQVMFGLNFKF